MTLIEFVSFLVYLICICTYQIEYCLYLINDSINCKKLTAN
jgi:hypothetical protein